MENHTQLAVIGGGPAGLRAAETAASAGIKVTLFDGKASVGRKFLVAGKGGLNLTHGEPQERFTSRYPGPDQPEGIWQELISDFDPQALRAWAAGLGVETFQAASGRVYPSAFKAAPLLRRWIARLKEMGVHFEMNHRWTGIQPGTPHQLGFANGRWVSADAVIFALGGGSWPQTGSDGSWAGLFQNSASPAARSSPRTAAGNMSGRRTSCRSRRKTLEKHPRQRRRRHRHRRTARHPLRPRRRRDLSARGRAPGQCRHPPSPSISSHLHPRQLVAKMESVRRGFLDEARVRWRLSDARHAMLDLKTWTDADSLAAR